MPELIDGRYQLLEVLASGGMATVWRARDIRLDRLVALKRPHPAPPDDPVHARIDREARAAAALNHPHLVTVYDVGRDENGPFLVMELVEGPTLAAAGTRLASGEAVQIGAQLADALAVVHAAGIVHRDIKPANVLMSDRGPQLTDFGIALDGDPSSRLTQPGSVVATPSYASPEQLAGRPATPRSDVFSLGVIVYELVTGQLPFSGTDRSGRPPPTGDRGLDAILGRALSQDPDARPDAAELGQSLRGAAPTVTAMAAGGSTVPMTVRPDQPPPVEQERRRGGALLMGGVALVAAVGLAALALAALDDDTAPGADTTAGPPVTTAPPPTTEAITSTTAATTTTSIATTTTAPTRDEGLEEARNDLEEALTAVHPSELNPKEAEELMEKADDAIAAVAEGKEEEAGQKLREVAREVDDKVEGDERDAVLARLVRLADAMGVSLEEGDGDDDGDD